MALSCLYTGPTKGHVSTSNRPVQPCPPFSPPSSPARLPPRTHLVDMPQPRTNQVGRLIRYTLAQIKQVKQARAMRHDWRMEAVGCSREIAERATLNMKYDLSMAMHLCNVYAIGIPGKAGNNITRSDEKVQERRGWHSHSKCNRPCADAKDTIPCIPGQLYMQRRDQRDSMLQREGPRCCVSPHI